MPVETEADIGDAACQALDSNKGVSHAAPSPEEHHKATERRIEAFDVEDDVTDVVHVLISWSLQAAETSYVEARLMGYAACVLATELFEIVSAQLPTIDPSSSSRERVQLPVARLDEEPRRSDIDVTCRHEIQVRLTGKAHVHTPSSTPRRSKRPAPSGSTASGSTPSTPTRPPHRFLFNATASTGEHPPGIPYSTAPPVVSPRKSMALLKTAFRMAVGRPSGTLSDAFEALEDNKTEGSSDSLDYETDRQARGGKTATRKASTCTGAPFSHAWSIILPRDKLVDSSDDDNEDDSDGGEKRNDLARQTNIEVEYVLPPVHPIVGRRASHLSPHHPRPLQSDEQRTITRGVFLATDEKAVVEIDPLGTVGYDMRARMTLSAGVRLQSEQGDVLDAGPELPVFPTKMRRSTFVDEAVASMALDMTSPLKLSSPQPWTAAEDGREDEAESQCSSGVFSLTECSCSAPTTAPKSLKENSRVPSTQSLQGSVASTLASTTSLSVKNLFRKPSKISRPCTASSQCCTGHTRNCTQPVASASLSTPSIDFLKNDFAGLVKQRAFQRKPSVVMHHAPPKKSQSRRSLLHSATSPLSRRRTTQSQASNNTRSTHDEDPLHRATPIM